MDQRPGRRQAVALAAEALLPRKPRAVSRACSGDTADPFPHPELGGDRRHDQSRRRLSPPARVRPGVGARPRGRRGARRRLRGEVRRVLRVAPGGRRPRLHRQLSPAPDLESRSPAALLSQGSPGDEVRGLVSRPRTGGPRRPRHDRAVRARDRLGAQLPPEAARPRGLLARAAAGRPGVGRRGLREQRAGASARFAFPPERRRGHRPQAPARAGRSRAAAGEPRRESTTFVHSGRRSPREKTSAG